MPPASSRKTFCEFFAGIGLVHEALRSSGWRCVYANDIDPKKSAMYRSHFAAAEHYHEGDVWRTDEAVAAIDGRPFLATASFPCTDMSLAGRMRGFAGEESAAFFGFARVLEELGDRRPPLVLLENVVGFLTSHDGADFLAAVNTLADLGYWIDAFVLDAKDFTPQSRPRLFVLGMSDQIDASGVVKQSTGENFLEDRWSQALAEFRSLRPPRLRELMHNTELSTGWAAALHASPPRAQHRLDEVIDFDDQQPWWEQDMVDKHYAMMSDRHREQVDRLRAAGERFVATVYRRIRQGQQRAEVRLDGLAGCLRTPRGGSARQIVLVIDRGELKMRWMTPREYARLQGAGDYKIECGVSQALFGFGDAVCVPVIRWIDQQVLTPLYEASQMELLSARTS